MLLEHLPLLSRTRLVLASASPRRAELLKQVRGEGDAKKGAHAFFLDLGPPLQSALLTTLTRPRPRPLLQVGLRHFEILPSTFDETLDKAAFPGGAAYAVATARAKAAQVAALVRAGMDGASSSALILAADTVVQAPDGTILEKPDGTVASATAMLASLSGAAHSVHTGVALVVLPATASASDADGPPPSRATFREFSESTSVTFESLSPSEIAAYVASGEGEGKAGGYGIQGPAGAWVSRLEGCYFNVVGLPLHGLARELAALVEAGVLV